MRFSFPDSCSLKTKKQAGFTLVELLVVIAIIGVLIGLLLPAVQSARESARRTACTNNLKQLGVALHAHLDAYKAFPRGMYANSTNYASHTAGGAGLAPGWTVRILPFIEQSALYDRFDWSARATWGGTNADIAKTFVSGFRCASDPGKRSTVGGGINYRGSAGPTFYYSSTTRLTAAQQIGLFNESIDLRDKDVTDGFANTIMIGETIIPSQDGDSSSKRAQMWHASFTGSARFPNLDISAIGTACDAGQANGSHFNRDSVYSTALSDQGHSSFREEGTMWTVGSALSSIFSTILNPNTPRANCINSSNANIVNREAVVSASSRHPAGVQVTFADGSVRMINAEILNDTWQRLGARNDGGVISAY